MTENKLKISKDTCIVCPTYELAKKLMEIFSKLGLRWDSGNCYNDKHTNWETYKIDTVYFPHEGLFGSIDRSGRNYNKIEAEEFIKLHNMESRNISITLEKAKEWYNSGSADLKEVALQAYTKEELEEPAFRKIKTFKDACKVLGIDPEHINQMSKGFYGANIFNKTPASIAALKLNIIRQALNKGYKIELSKGTVWYPNNRFIKSGSDYYDTELRNGTMQVLATFITDDGIAYHILGGRACPGVTSGLGSFYSFSGVGNSAAAVGFLGCASKGIAEHMSKYFAKEIFEAKYNDLVSFKWV